MKILIVGCGSIGLRHLENFKKIDNCRVLALRTSCDDIAAFERKYGVKVFTDFKKALAEKPEAVVISNPTSLHVKYAISAAEAGCHLLIEKPISDGMRDIDKLIKIIEKKKLVALIGCNLRFHEQLARIKKLLERSAIGKVYFARLSVGSYLPKWRLGSDYAKSYSGSRKMGGGVVLDLIHEIDYALWLFGEVSGLDASVGKLSDLEIDTEDYAEIFLKFKSGACVQIHMDYLNRFLSRECEIVGQSGNIKWNYTNNTLEISRIKDKSPETQVLKKYDRNEMYVAEAKHFLNCINGREKPLVTVYDGKRALEVALAAKKVGMRNIKKV